jgi:hypothetical protein
MVVNFRACGISRGTRKLDPNTHFKLKEKKLSKVVVSCQINLNAPDKYIISCQSTMKLPMKFSSPPTVLSMCQKCEGVCGLEWFWSFVFDRVYIKNMYF